VKEDRHFKASDRKKGRKALLIYKKCLQGGKDEHTMSPPFKGREKHSRSRNGLTSTWRGGGHHILVGWKVKSPLNFVDQGEKYLSNQEPLEAISGANKDPRVDKWRLGSSVVHMLTGVRIERGALN